MTQFGPPWASGRRSSAIAIVVTAIQIVGTHFAGQHQPHAEALDALAWSLVVGSGLALLFRNRYPTAVLAVVAGAIVVYHALNYPNGPIFFSLVVAIVNAVLHDRRAAAWAIAGASYVGYFVLAALVGRDNGPVLGASLGIAAWLLLLLVLAEFIRNRRKQAIEASRSRAEEERRRASEERLRVARELHDVLAHNISLINVQAGVALHLIDERPEQARTALAAIKQASKDALGELRSVLGVLRQPDDAAPRDPAPRLERLDDLVEQARAAGLRVHVDVDGPKRDLPAPVDVAAFRILQEALTNVTKHAGLADVTVQLRYEADRLVVVVDDDGSGAPAVTPSGQGTGSGVLGMRERASALGGEVTAGPRAGGGFRVEASLPLEER